MFMKVSYADTKNALQHFEKMKRSTSGSFSSLKPEPWHTSKKKKHEKTAHLTPTAPSEAPKRKPVWKKVGSSNQEAVTVDPANLPDKLDVNKPSTANEENDPSGAVRNGWYHERYDPKFISGCDSSCRVCRGKEDRIAV